MVAICRALATNLSILQVIVCQVTSLHVKEEMALFTLYARRLDLWGRQHPHVPPVQFLSTKGGKMEGQGSRIRGSEEGSSSFTLAKNLRWRPHSIAARGDRSEAWQRQTLNRQHRWLQPVALPMHGDVTRVGRPLHPL